MCISLKDIVESPKAPPMTEAEAAMLMKQTLNILKEAHSRGVYHRNLRPSSIVFHTFGDTDVLMKKPPFKSITVEDFKKQLTVPVPRPSSISLSCWLLIQSMLEVSQENRSTAANAYFHPFIGQAASATSGESSSAPTFRITGLSTGIVPIEVGTLNVNRLMTLSGRNSQTAEEEEAKKKLLDELEALKEKLKKQEDINKRLEEENKKVNESLENEKEDREKERDEMNSIIMQLNKDLDDERGKEKIFQFEISNLRVMLTHEKEEKRQIVNKKNEEIDQLKKNMEALQAEIALMKRLQGAAKGEAGLMKLADARLILISAKYCDTHHRLRERSLDLIERRLNKDKSQELKEDVITSGIFKDFGVLLQELPWGEFAEQICAVTSVLLKGADQDSREEAVDCGLGKALKHVILQPAEDVKRVHTLALLQLTINCPNVIRTQLYDSGIIRPLSHLLLEHKRAIVIGDCIGTIEQLIKKFSQNFLITFRRNNQQSRRWRCQFN
ncbi:MAG: hypothetical protein EZS28_028224 [Streblomastix strix]|uniref:Protein kinase domain-containing protein n=1 Tax=Streblomastix strix TaxID=222440 RepID=A0A5J4V1J4_9EUKA|nr:MAG: hypothetical protein EZS28_028224 [Streblomastix strix]